MTPRDAFAFTFHDPEVRPEVAAARRSAAEARRVVRALVASTAAPDRLAAAADQLRALADELEEHAPTSRYEGTAGIKFGAPDERRGNADVLESHPLLGPSNALAPPITMHGRATGPDDEATGPVVATATYGHAYEGPPGCVHGGMLAAAFDIVLGAAAATTQRPALTGTLTIRYRRPTPLHTEVRYEGEVDRVEERRTHVVARSIVDGQVTCEAEGVFVCVDPARLAPGPAGSE